MEWDREGPALAAVDSVAVDSARGVLPVRDSVSSAVGANRVTVATARASVGLAAAPELLAIDRAANEAVASARRFAQAMATADLVLMALRQAERSARPTATMTRRHGGRTAAQVSAGHAADEIRLDRATETQIAVTARIAVRATAIGATQNSRAEFFVSLIF